MRGEKEKWTYTGKNKQEKAVSLPHNTTCHCQSVYKYELSVLYSCGDFLTKNMERKKKEQIQRRTNRRWLILYPMIQLAIVNLYTKYEVSISNSLRDIFDEKLQYLPVMHGEKAKWTYTGKNKQEKAGFISHNTTCHCQSVHKIWTFWVYTVMEISLTKNMERKKNNKYREEQTGEESFSIPWYNLSLSTCIPNMKFLS